MDSRNWSPRVLGIDRKRADLSASDEHAYFHRISVQMVSTGAFIFMMAFSGISIALGNGHWVNPIIAAIIAALVATQLVLMDIGLIETSHIARAEAALGAPGGGDDGDGSHGRWRRILPRLAIAVTLSWTFGTFGDLYIFQPEIEQTLDLRHMRANAALIEEKRGVVQREIGDARQQVEALEKESSQLLSDAKAIEEAGSAELTAATAEISGIDARVKALADTKARLGEERGIAIQNRDMEAQGVAIEGRTSGKDGCGKLCKRWSSEVERLDSAMVAADDETQSLKTRRVVLEDQRKLLAEKATAGASKGVAEKHAARDVVKGRLEDARRRVRALEKAEAATVQERVLADPRYVKREDGLAARFVALKEVAWTYPSTLFVMVLVSMAIMAVELGTVLSVEFGGRKTRYFLETVMAYRQLLHVLLTRNDTYRAGPAEPPFEKPPSPEATHRTKESASKPEPKEEEQKEFTDIDTLFDRFASGMSDGDVPKAKRKPDKTTDHTSDQVVELKPNGASRQGKGKPGKNGYDVIT